MTAARVDVPGEAGERITLEAVHSPGYLPEPRDVELAVEVAARGFAGRNPGVWVDRAALDAFMSALRGLEATRRGAAELVSLSPGELTLGFRSVGRAGRIQARCDLSTTFPTALGWTDHRVTVLFELPGEMLPGVLAAFARLTGP